MSFHFIEHTADIAVEIKAASVEEIFTTAALAWQHSVLEEVNIRNEEIKIINLSEGSIEELLVSFLQEINFLLFTRKWIYSSTNEIKILGTNSKWVLNSKISGEKYKPDKHSLKEEIKAVTFHQMNIEKTRDGFRTRIVFDI